MVRYWNSLRPLRISGPCRRSVCFGPPDESGYACPPRRNLSALIRFATDLDFDKSNEILFRLGIIYKQRSKYKESLSCFEKILQSPPNPLAHADIWFQIGHVHEQQNDVRLLVIPVQFHLNPFSVARERQDGVRTGRGR